MTYQQALPISDTAAAQRLHIKYESIVSTFIFMMLACSGISIIEPSPYDFLALITVPLWFFGGFRLHHSLMLILITWILYTIIGFIALTPYWHEPDPSLFQLQSLFLLVTVGFFSVYFSERTETRVEIAMIGYTCSALLAALVGIVGYMNIPGLGEFGTMYEGRASGTFKDPNVLGSFLILAITFLVSKLLMGTTRRPILVSICLGIAVIGQFLTFSRGSWTASVLALLMLSAFAYGRVAGPAMRKRIIVIGVTCVVLAIAGIAALLSDQSTRELLTLRASVTQDYDVGETGRFGNQMRAIQTLLGKPEGFGPLRLRLTFQLDPHNSYIGAFANFGWVGGFIWLFICSTTVFVGLRMMWRRSAIQHLAIGVVPAMCAMLLQGFQIDVDHWRHVYIGFGVVWGLEAARQRWEFSRHQSAG